MRPLSSEPKPAVKPPSAASGLATASSSPQDTRLTARQLQQIVRLAAAATETLTRTCRAFWGVPVRLTFLTAATRFLYFWRMDNFYVSQAGRDIHLRLSDSACATLLSQVLGEREGSQVGTFGFNTLTPLEANLLTSFTRDLLSVLAKALIHPRALAPKTTEAAEGPLLHLVWMLMPETSEELLENDSTPDAEAGKLVLTLPLAAFKQDLEADQDEGISAQAAFEVVDHFFMEAFAETWLAIGSTRVPIADLQALEPGDLVVLENSSASQLALVEPHSQEKIIFGVQMANRAKIEAPLSVLNELSLTQELNAVNNSHTPTQQTKQALWDNLMIEVGAEFEPIKLPLKQIKQMSEGLVVEIGDLVNNEVYLTVEGKILAKGQLVIVGDQFGVRVVELEPERQEVKRVMAPQPPGQTASQNLPAPTQSVAQQHEVHDQDGDEYDDFEDNAPDTVSTGADASNLDSLFDDEDEDDDW